jgi:cardiolipin synthase
MGHVSHRCPGNHSQLPIVAVSAAAGAAVAILISRNFWETEKKIKHQILADYGVGDPVFIRTMSQLLGPPLLEGNKVTALKNGDEIFPAMLRAIRGAQRSVTFENFVWQEGRISSEFAEALAERAHAGVKVHVLQDALGCGDLRCDSMKTLRRSPAELEIFRFLRLSQINMRTHRKLLVIDGRIGFLGGVGIADPWDGDADAADRWRDMQYQVEGPVVAQMQQAFMDNWMQTRAEVLHGDDYFPEIPRVGDDLCQVFKSSASEGADSARVMLLLSIAAARRSIRIANPYFIPDDLTIQTLVEACERGVQLEVITCGPLIDQKLVRLVGRSRWGPLLEAGAHLYEYETALFHCKYMIVDDRWLAVGSANIDNRSLRLNEEANLNILDDQLGAEHVEIFEEDKRHSREVTMSAWRRRPLREKIVGTAGCVFRSQM